MIADVWSKRDFVVAGIVLAAVAVVALGQFLDLTWLTIAGGLAAVAGVIVLIAWRIVAGPDPRHHRDGRV